MTNFKLVTHRMLNTFDAPPGGYQDLPVIALPK